MPPPPPPPGAAHSQFTDDLLTTDADAAATGVLVPWAASQPAADGGKKPGADGGKKLGAIARVWSEADEVRILEGLAAYTAAHGAEPQRSQLHAALQGCCLDKAEFTITEIYEKVRRLRIKYANLRSAGTVTVPAGGDEARKYELSMAIWGDGPLNVIKKVGANASRVTNAGASAGAGKNAAPGTRVRRAVEELQGLYPSLALAVEGITADESLRPDAMGLSDLEFSHGLEIEKLVAQRFGCPVSPLSPSSTDFRLVASFGRSSFRLNVDSAALALQSCLGGDSKSFKVSHLSDGCLVSTSPARKLVF